MANNTIICSNPAPNLTWTNHHFCCSPQYPHRKCFQLPHHCQPETAEGSLCQQNPCGDHSPNVALKGQASCYLCMWHSHPHEDGDGVKQKRHVLLHGVISSQWNYSTRCFYQYAVYMLLDWKMVSCWTSGRRGFDRRAGVPLRTTFWREGFEEDEWGENELSKDERAQIHCTPAQNFGKACIQIVHVHLVHFRCT